MSGRTFTGFEEPEECEWALRCLLHRAAQVRVNANRERSFAPGPARKTVGEARHGARGVGAGVILNQ